MWQQLLEQLQQGNIKALARSISLVENEHPGYEELLEALPHNNQPHILGITGPPGAGKSTLTDGIIRELVDQHLKVAVLCVDPSSPFNLGAVLGDRIRMSDWYTHPQVYIRSLATRGAMGGLHPKIIEITDLLKAAAFDYIIVETVGVGQSEIEIAGLADTTLVVLVPEAGDEVQTMKAGLMEIADIFVVNKSDRPDADAFAKNLRLMLAPTFSTHKTEVPVIKTVASQHQGFTELMQALQTKKDEQEYHDKKLWLLTEKVFQLVQHEKMKTISKQQIRQQLEKQAAGSSFNIYRFAKSYF